MSDLVVSNLVDQGGDATARREAAVRQVRHIFAEMEYLVRSIESIPGPEFDRQQRAIFVRLLTRAQRQLEVVMWRGAGGACISCGAQRGSQREGTRFRHFEDCVLAELVAELAEATR